MEEDCQMILDWVRITNADFDTDTVEGIQSWEYDYTSSQESAISNIIDKFNIAKWYYKTGKAIVDEENRLARLRRKSRTRSRVNRFN